MSSDKKTPPPIKSEPSKDQLDGEESICWDEALFNKSYNQQIELLIPKPVTPSASKKKKNKRTKDQSQSTDGATTSNELKFKNVSQIFRYNEDESISGDNNVNCAEVDEQNQTSPKVLLDQATSDRSEVPRNSKIPLMPPPPTAGHLSKAENLDEAHASMLMSWYVAGYHTGYYEAVKKFSQKQQSSNQ